MLRKGNKVLQKKNGKLKKKTAFSSSFTLILEEKQDRKNTGRGLTSLDDDGEHV